MNKNLNGRQLKAGVTHGPIRRALFFRIYINDLSDNLESMTSFWCFYNEVWTYFTPFSVSIVDFEQVNVSWVKTSEHHAH